MKKKKYSQVYPKRSYMNNYPPDIPYSYNYKYNLNLIGSQNIIGNRKYYEAKENNQIGCFEENGTFFQNAEDFGT